MIIDSARKPVSPTWIYTSISHPTKSLKNNLSTPNFENINKYEFDRAVAAWMAVKIICHWWRNCTGKSAISQNVSFLWTVSLQPNTAESYASDDSKTIKTKKKKQDKKKRGNLFHLAGLTISVLVDYFIRFDQNRNENKMKTKQPKQLNWMKDNNNSMILTGKWSRIDHHQNEYIQVYRVKNRID